MRRSGDGTRVRATRGQQEVKLPPRARSKRELGRTKVKIDEVLCLVCNVGAEVAAHDAVPRGGVLLVELLLHVGSNVLLDVVLLEGLPTTKRQQQR